MLFGVFKRHDLDSTEMLPDVRKRRLQQVIRGKLDLDSVTHSDGWRSDHGFVDVGYAKHFRVETWHAINLRMTRLISTVSNLSGPRPN